MNKRGANHRPKARSFNPAHVTIEGHLEMLLAAHVRDLAVRNYSAHTIAMRQQLVRYFMDWMAERGVTQGAEVTRSMIERYQRYLFAYRKSDGQPLGIKSQHGRLKNVELFFRWCVRKHYLPSNPASDLDYPRPVRAIPQVLTQEEIGTIFMQPNISSAVGIRDRCMLEVLYSTGIRRMEISSMRVDDVNFSAGIVRIDGKGNKERLVPIGSSALHWLNRYIAEVRSQWIFGHADPSQRMFLAVTGDPLHPVALSSIISTYVAAAEIGKQGRCHIFRHSMATHLLENGCDVRLIQEMLGHSNLDTTARYTHVAVAQMKQAHDACHPTSHGRQPLHNEHTHDEHTRPAPQPINRLH